MQATCPVCSSAEREDVLSLPAMPVLINAQVRPEVAATTGKGDIDLVVCSYCGHLYNRAFDDGLLDYDATYENTLHFSPKFREFAEDLARRLVEDHGLAGRPVAELGSGPGHFLSMLCDAGVRRGWGFDPSYDAHREQAPDNPSVEISTARFPSSGTLSVGLAYSQHVLEHLPDPVAALRDQGAAVVDDNGVVYSEVPNGQLMIERTALWDLIYEHLSYFVPSSLQEACRRAGLRVTRLGTSFGDQFLWSEARVDESCANDHERPIGAEDGIAAARRFGRAAAARIDEACAALDGWTSEGPVALWGAGSKGATFLNLVDRAQRIAAVVDINPRKIGWGVPGTQHVIISPDQLVDVSPAVVIAANPVYRNEISAGLRSRGLRSRVELLWE